MAGDGQSKRLGVGIKGCVLRQAGVYSVGAANTARLHFMVRYL